MNLVIDDAVEVKQATKTDPDEKRRELGITPFVSTAVHEDANHWDRSDTTKGG